MLTHSRNKRWRQICDHAQCYSRHPSSVCTICNNHQPCFTKQKFPPLDQAVGCNCWNRTLSRSLRISASVELQLQAHLQELLRLCLDQYLVLRGNQPRFKRRRHRTHLHQRMQIPLHWLQNFFLTGKSLHKSREEVFLVRWQQVSEMKKQ